MSNNYTAIYVGSLAAWLAGIVLRRNKLTEIFGKCWSDFSKNAEKKFRNDFFSA